MPLIQNIPSNLLNEHHHWHDPTAHPGAGGGRQIPFGSPGAGLEFLQIHRDFLSRFLSWYQTQTGADLSAVAPWPVIPSALKNPGLTGWNATLAAQEARITTNNPSFASADVLGTYIEGGIHGWLHNASAIVFGEPVLANFHSPQSTYFYQIHGLVDRWWQLFESGPVQPGATALTVDAPPVQGSITPAGETNLFTFSVQAASRFRIETQGSIDVVMSLHGPNNLAALIAEDDDSSGNFNALIERNLSPGTYFVRVRHYSPTQTGTYEISVRRVALSIPAIPVNGAPVQGTIAAPNEIDSYSFTADAAGLYTIETGGNLDTVMSLFGPNNQSTFIAEDDDNGPGYNARIVASLAPGTYHVRVRLYSAVERGHMASQSDGEFHSLVLVR